MNAYRECAECLAYYDARHEVLVPAIVEQAVKEGSTPHAVFRRYMPGVHRRHLDGLPIMPQEAS